MVMKYQHPDAVYGCDWSPHNACVLFYLLICWYQLFKYWGAFKGWPINTPVETAGKLNALHRHCYHSNNIQNKKTRAL